MFLRIMGHSFCDCLVGHPVVIRYAGFRIRCAKYIIEVAGATRGVLYP